VGQAIQPASSLSSGLKPAGRPAAARIGCPTGLFLLWAVAGFAQQNPTFRVDVNLVRVLATVKDGAGRLVGTLDKEDFSLSDNGAPQQIAVFERRTEQPLLVSLLIDCSGSTAKDLKYEVESVNRFLRALFSEGNPKDALALYSFNYEVRELNHFTRNQASLERSLKGLRGEAGTSLYDAIYFAARDLEDRDGRKVIVVVTDGGDTTSVKDFHAALKAAQLADAVIYSVLVTPITNDAGRNIGGENALTTLGERTGGRVFAPNLGPGIDRAFTDILRELRTQYLLGFYPKDTPLTADPFHKIAIKAHGDDLRVSSRNGYYGETEKSGAKGAKISVVPRDSRY
jgi:Ca-activated chloride channel family protein